MALRTFMVWLMVMVSCQLVASEKNIDEFVEGMQHKTGFYDLYYQTNSGKLYLLLDRLNEDFLFQTSMPHGVGSNDIGLDRGQLGDTKLVRFERFGDKVLLKQLNTQFRVTTDNVAERASIDEAFADSVLAGLPIVAQQDNKVLVDYTDYLLSDVHFISVRLKDTKQGSFKADPSRSGVYLPRTKSFPDNTEMEALVTYGGTNPGKYLEQVAPDPTSITVHLHHSLVRLPDEQYQPRKFHPFSGYWSVSYLDYSVPIEAQMEQKLIPRHRLVKKDPDAQVSEAVEPIVYYLDPGIPEPIKSALYDGAMWWDQAFEAIGYTGAFRVETLPEGADPMDVRYNVIQWVHRATRGWSYGGSVIDPRTAEIIKGHVTLGSLRVRQDYLIALGLTSPFSVDEADTRAQKEMALARIRQLSAHEVGHTLGIAHNFAASTNDRASVMDYPHPKAQIKKGKIVLDGAYATGIGEWDKHVIAYGYQDVSDSADEGPFLANQIRQTRDSGLKYQSDPDSRAVHTANSLGHMWDNGADPLAELKRINQVRKLALEQFGLNSIPNGQSLSSLQETLVPVYLMHRYQTQAVAKLLGGVEYEYELKGDHDRPKGVQPVNAERQKLALQALLNTMSPAFLAIPDRLHNLIPPKAYGEKNTRESFNGRTGLTFDPVSAAESAAAFSLSLTFNPQRLNRVAEQHSRDPKYLSVNKLVEALFERVVKREKTRIGRQIQGRIAYLAVDAVVKAIQNPDVAPEAQGEMLQAALELNKWLKKNQKSAVNVMLYKQLDWYLATGEWHSRFSPKPLPPGSPI